MSPPQSPTERHSPAEVKEHEHILCCDQVCRPMGVQDTTTTTVRLG